MKKQLILLLCMFLTSVSSMAEDVVIGNIKYSLDTSTHTASVISSNYSGDIVIPASVTYNSTPYSVTSIGVDAFFLCTGLTSIDIPNSVTSIGLGAFNRCTGLTSVNIPNGVTSIGSTAFATCTSLSSINIPSSVTSIGGDVFVSCSNLSSITVEKGNSVYDSRNSCNAIIETATNKLIVGCKNSFIPDGVTSIGNEAFYDCVGLSSITIPNGVTTIDVRAFWHCTGLSSITIPSSVTNIESNSFTGCTGLNDLVVEDGNTVYDSRNNCKAIIETATNTLIIGCQSTSIPSSVTKIRYLAFESCSGLTSVTIPKDVTSIGMEAFRGCSSLTSVVSEVETPFIFGNNAFTGISADCVLTVPYGTRDAYIAAGWTEDVFKGGIVEMSAPAPNPDDIIIFADANVKSLCVANWDKNGDGELSYSEAAAVTDISFQYNNSFTSFNELQYFTGLTSIGENAFYRCSGLTSIEIPNSVTSIGDYAFFDCSGLTSITIPNGVTSIGWGTFSSCSGLTSITIPNSVTSIGGDAFFDCSGLTSIEIPNSVTSIGGSAFQNCSGLTSVTIPYSVTSIGNLAFSGCTNITSLNLNCKTIGNWFGNIRTSITSVTLGESVTSIGDNAFNGFSSLTSIEIPNRVTSIGGSAFQNCSGLTSITIPNSVTSIGNYAFSNCSGLTSIAIPNSVTSIGGSAFSGCSALTSLSIPASVETIGDAAFVNCSALTSVVFEDGDLPLFLGMGVVEDYQYDDYDLTHIMSVYRYGLFGQSPLNTLYIGRNLSLNNYWVEDDDSEFLDTMTGLSMPYNYCFFGSGGLTRLEVGSNVNSFPRNFFKYLWSSNTIVDIKGGIEQWCNFDFSQQGTNPLEYINNGTLLFDGVMLTGSVTIPESVTNIPSHTFKYSCSGITDLTLPSGLTTIAVDAFKKVLPSLGTIQLVTSNTHFTIEDNVLYNKEKTKIICFPRLRAGDYIMPNTITAIDEYQFYNCVNLTDVIFSNSLGSISKYAFSGCALLTSLTIPATVANIYDCAFDGCTSITDLVIEDAGTTLSIGKNGGRVGLFHSSPIQDVYIGRNLELKDYDGSGWNRGAWTSSLKTPFTDALKNIVIGNLVNHLPGGLFSECWGIRSVNFNGTITEWCNITFEDSDATPFGKTIAGNENMSPILYLQGQPLHSQVNIPEGATKVGAYSFYGQNGVENITLPSTIQVIEAYAFAGAGDVYINANNVVTLQNTNSFSGDIYVPDAVLTNYRTANVWSEIESRIYPLGFLTVTVDLVAMQNSPALLPALNALEVVNGEYRITRLTNLKIRGTMNGWDILMIRNKMPNLRHLDLSEATILDNDGGYEYYTGNHVTAPNTVSTHSFFELNNLCSLKLPLNVVTIEENAVSGCPNLERVELPQQLTTIGSYAFANCPRLREVLYMPETCTYIGYGAFSNTGLTSIDISNGVKTIGASAFSGCHDLSVVVFREGLETIDSYAFSGCSSLREITFAKGLKTIGNGAFSNSGITKLVFPTTLKRIEAGAFSNCYQLREIDFAEGLTEIGSGAFQYCSQLRELHLPTSLRTIAGSAFQYCNSLSEIHVPSMLYSIGDYAFKDCGLNSVYAYTLVPIQINQNTFDYDGVNLFAPDNSFYAYYLNTQWSQFQDVQEFEALYTQWYASRNSDVEINVVKPIRNKDNNNPADGELQPGSGLIFVGDGEQLVNKLILNWEHGTNYPSLIENNNLDVEELRFIMNVYPGRWYFFSFPFDIQLKNMSYNGKYVWRYYDGETRAQNGSGGWKNVEDGVLHANRGYIFQCNTAGDLDLPVEDPRFEDVFGTNTDSKEVPLESYESTNPADASWNLVGNPNLSYYDIDKFQERDPDCVYPPITVWDEEQQTYTAVVPGDDEYDFHPFQAFFVQPSDEVDHLSFNNDDRQTYAQSQRNAQARRLARAARRVNEKRLLVNISISDGKTTDKTRVIFNDDNKLNYEKGVDANKFMSMADVPQIYTLDGLDVKYSINARPNGNREVRVGFVANKEGEYTITSTQTDCFMALKDHMTGKVHVFDGKDYTFLSDKGTFDNRFTLIPANDITAISEGTLDSLSMMVINGGIAVAGATEGDVNIYNTNGVKAATVKGAGTTMLPGGTYIVTYAGQAIKILVK